MWIQLRARMASCVLWPQSYSPQSYFQGQVRYHRKRSTCAQVRAFAGAMEVNFDSATCNVSWCLVKDCMPLIVDRVLWQNLMEISVGWATFLLWPCPWPFWTVNTNGTSVFLPLRIYKKAIIATSRLQSLTFLNILHVCKCTVQSCWVMSPT